MVYFCTLVFSLCSLTKNPSSALGTAENRSDVGTISKKLDKTALTLLTCVLYHAFLLTVKIKIQYIGKIPLSDENSAIFLEIGL